ncbi:uncharacterized protein H6S33_012047 [Morchella sextelata]|uniref:uncharacterized protein n=1 Tax=Morchella sextelata TaxID=1174677 RepID=UPI001D03F38E|nr:uncharacterized protein H6S33_012047 [Morchella sextelata]KAH0610520.1 hypothetical protein H6S33_012047 [Morchella sextelata]
MSSSSQNRLPTAVKGGSGLTKTPANTSSDPDSSTLHSVNSGLHDTHDQTKPSVAKNDMKASGTVGDGTKIGRMVKEGAADFIDNLAHDSVMDPSQS